MNKCITNQNNYAYVYIYSPTQVYEIIFYLEKSNKLSIIHIF